MKVAATWYEDASKHRRWIVTFYNPGGPSSVVLDDAVWQHVKAALATDKSFEIEEEL